jgi:hypothetical protein
MKTASGSSSRRLGAAGEREPAAEQTVGDGLLTVEPTRTCQLALRKDAVVHEQNLQL